MAKSNSASKWGMIIGVLISVVILVALFSQIEWALFFNELSRVDYKYFPLLFLIVLASYWIRAIRWRYLIPNGRELSTRKLFDACCVGFFATFVLPLRAGEFVRPWALSRWQPVKFSVGFASVVTERVFDVLTLLLLLGLSLSRLESAPLWLLTAAKGLGLLAVVIGGVMIFAYIKGDTLLRLVDKILSALLRSKRPQLADTILGEAGNFISGLRAISCLADLILVIVWSLVLWGSFIGMYFVGFMLFGEFPSLWVGTVVCVLVGLAVAAPSAPGFLGTFQLGCVAAMTGVYQYSNEFSMAYSVVHHSFQMLCAVGLGLFVLGKSGLSLKEMRAERQERQD